MNITCLFCTWPYSCIWLRNNKYLTTRDKSKPYQRNKYLVRYSGPFLKWTRDELTQMDRRTRKLMTMHKALHPRDDVDRLYV